ncbi:MAG TPA: hypothetical protein VNW92_24075 [Polyangiaceae bacterium]|jgi:hypothetical protein|nr:hypothetical protein [Polyangiaceae bacterium]
MKRLSGRVFLGGLSSGLSVLMTVSCSSTSSPIEGGGNNTSSGGSSNTSHGGTNTVGTGGSAIGVGGNGLAQGGTGTLGTGGSGAIAGGAGLGTGGSAGGTGAVCSTDPNLVNATGCFVGCDPTLGTDNPQGIQGAFYTFGDGSSCTTPLLNPPCATGGICLTGSTVVDATYAKWGCGIGLELNATGGTPSVKQPYAGSASCFNYTLTGNSGGNEVRIAFTQTADTTGRVSPYVSVMPFSSGATGTICTKDVSCQGQMNCALTNMQYDLQIEVVGGNHAGAYNVCLSSLTPVTSGSSTLTQLCGAQGVPGSGNEDVGKYVAQNNVTTSGDKLCLTPALNGAAASFKIDSATFATGATLNAYPSIVDGWHYGRVSTDPALPKAISALVSANSTVSYTGSDNKYDAAYDIWVLPTTPSASVKTPAGGLEVMIWLNASNVSPAGSQVGTFNGYSVWTGTVQNWNYVAYEKSGQTTFSGDLAPFIQDAASRKGTEQAASGGGPYLAGIEFGFELYDYPGTGFAVTSFTSDVK